ncbi:hypothetical protein NPIL_55451 [Nephila pilipes]|uniref:Uncharacterized protein n=1 Tax=Nephila pilipes TaxID=299642 RepID=A0A8X6MPR5_NEPPI|nr:hypothetical protein NPIL_55451 [Nephila pilipes]
MTKYVGVIESEFALTFREKETLRKIAATPRSAVSIDHPMLVILRTAHNAGSHTRKRQGHTCAAISHFLGCAPPGQWTGQQLRTKLTIYLVPPLRVKGSIDFTTLISCQKAWMLYCC